MYRKNHRPCGGLSFEGQVTRTQSHLAKQTSVQYMLERCLRGDTSVLNNRPNLGNALDVPDDLQSLLNKQLEARRAYEELPIEVRNAYPTPQAFFNACHDKTQIEKLRQLGLVETPATPATPAQAVTPEGSEGSTPKPSPNT